MSGAGIVIPNAEVRAGMAKSAATENFILGYEYTKEVMKPGEMPRNNVKSAEQSQSWRLSRCRAVADVIRHELEAL